MRGWGEASPFRAVTGETLSTDLAGDTERYREGPRLRIDADQAWDRVTALRVLRALEGCGIEFCEQPCPAADHGTLRDISEQSPVPIMADESLFTPQDALAVDREGAVSFFNIKLSKSGGIHHALQIAHIAQAGGRRCMIGSLSESRLGLTAAAHFALAAPIVTFRDLDTFHELGEDPVLGGIQIRNGMLAVPDEPGLGATPDESYLAKRRQT